MNEKAMEFIQGLGALTEVWLVAYANFKKQNLSDAEAFAHTREFMKVIMSSITGLGGSK